MHYTIFTVINLILLLSAIICKANNDSTVQSSTIAIFYIPFEASFANVQTYDFNTKHKSSFINTTAVFFNISVDNISLAFVGEVSQENYVDVGYSIIVNDRQSREQITSSDMNAYRSYISLNVPSFPNIASLDLKVIDCDSDGKYGSYFKAGVECQWICERDYMYDGESSTCVSIQISIVKYDSYPIYFAYGTFLVSMLFTCLIFYRRWIVCISATHEQMENMRRKLKKRKRKRKKKKKRKEKKKENELANNNSMEGKNNSNKCSLETNAYAINANIAQTNDNNIFSYGCPDSKSKIESNCNTNENKNENEDRFENNVPCDQISVSSNNTIIKQEKIEDDIEFIDHDIIQVEFDDISTEI